MEQKPKTLEQINKEREEQLAKMIVAGELGLMTETAMGTTIGDLTLNKDKVKNTDKK